MNSLAIYPTSQLCSILDNEHVGKLIRIYKHHLRNDGEKKGNDNKMVVDMNNYEVENLLLMEVESLHVIS